MLVVPTCSTTCCMQHGLSPACYIPSLPAPQIRGNLRAPRDKVLQSVEAGVRKLFGALSHSMGCVRCVRLDLVHESATAFHAMMWQLWY